MMMDQWFSAPECDSSQCVEVQWRKSQLSSTNGSCVEVGVTPEEILVRDSKDPSGPVLSYTRDEWLAFLDGAKKGEFDL